MSVHAPYAVLDFDGPVEAPRRLGKLFLDRVGIFAGLLGNYGGMHRNVPVASLELPHANRLPPDIEVKKMWADLLKWTDQRLVVARAEPPKPPAPAVTVTAPTPLARATEQPEPALVPTPAVGADAVNPAAVPQ